MPMFRTKSVGGPKFWVAAILLLAAYVVQPVGSGWVAVAQAQDGRIREIQVVGNRRVEPETVRSYLKFSVGDNYDAGKVDQSLRSLFATGLFADVQINQRGSTLVVVVDEYMVVNQVLFQGNKKIKDDQLASSVQLQPRGTFSTATLEADAQTVRDAYSRIGRDDAVVTTQVIELGDNRVNVVFEINEGGRTKIASVNFVGNNA